MAAAEVNSLDVAWAEAVVDVFCRIMLVGFWDGIRLAFGWHSVAFHGIRRKRAFQLVPFILVLVRSRWHSACRVTPIIILINRNDLKWLRL